MRGLLAARNSILKAIVAINADMKRLERASAVCRRLMTIPGVGRLPSLPRLTIPIASDVRVMWRLGELVGLRKEDVSLDPPIPFIYIRPHEKLGHSLKTPGSERVVLLLHSAYWAAHQALLSPITSGWLFPRYASDGSVRATHASNTVNKYISETLHIPKTSHSFRHSMKDLLREFGCPDPIQRQLLGHGAKSVADSYGQGYSLTVLRDHLRKALALLDSLDGFVPSGDSTQALPPPDGKGRLLR